MHRPQVPLGYQLQKEGTHCVRGQQIQVTLRLTKTWQVDPDEVEPLGQAVPDLSEGQHTLRPWAGQDDRFALALPSFGEADLQGVCFSDR